MPDTLQSFTVSRSSDGGVLDAWSDITSQGSPQHPARYWDDHSANADPAQSPTGAWWYQVGQTTADGVNVPYNFVVIAQAEYAIIVDTPDGSGYAVTAAANPLNQTELVLTWTVPTDSPVAGFDVSGKPASAADLDENWELITTVREPGRRSVIVPSILDQGLYEYRLRGIVL